MMAAVRPSEPSPASTLSPRLIAVQAVIGTLRDGVALELPAGVSGLSQRDRALAMEIAAGTVRHLSTLDFLLKSCIARPPAEKHHFLWAVLRTALYQSLYMRVPDRAAVNEAVTLIKSSRENNRAGFVNGVLRAVVQVDRAALFAGLTDPIQRLAVESSHPEWLVRRWWQSVGEAVTRQRVWAGNQVAPLTLRANRLATTREQMLASLGAGARTCALAAEGIILEGASGPVEKIPGYGNGWFAVQDQAAQLVSHFVNPQAGDAVLDACAAPGGKTAHLAALANVHLTAVEKEPARVARLRENLHRLRVPNVEIVVGDVGDSALLGERRFDRALVDAPCTGTGVIRRHPDIKWRRNAADIERMAMVQEKILTEVAKRVVSGGWLVYATCSLEPEENQRQIGRFLQHHPQWQRVPMEGGPITQDGDFQSEPGEQEMDGFYAARLQRS